MNIRPVWAAIAVLLTLGSPSLAQDMRPAAEDVEAIRALMRDATRAILEKDARAFTACCDPYLYCYFADGTLVRGRDAIEDTLRTYFARRPAGLSIRLDELPRSYRVLSPEVVMVDWPAALDGPEGELRLNTLTTLRKADGRWQITAYLESVPYTLPSREPPAGR